MAGQTEWTELLTDLVRRLEVLEADGVRHLSIAPDPEMAKLRPAPHAPTGAAASVDGAHVGTMPETSAEPSPRARRPFPQVPGEPTAIPGEAAAERPAPRAPVGPQVPTHEIATLESLYIRFRDCQACKLCDTRNRLVFGTGSDRPRLMFIGEGPGAEEDAQGLPFVGRAGQLLTGLIAALGLVREDVYITNVVKCRPPGNRNPEPDEVAACRPILKRQIELLDPGLIVTLGNVPLKALNPGAGGITRERGRVFTYERWQVLPTFHPSYLLRSPDAIGDCWSDFRQALSLVYPGT